MSMYCPRCAKEAETGTAYCRTCGLSLDGIAVIVNGEAESEPEFKTGPNRELMRFGMGSFILGIVIALGNALVRDLGLWPYDFGKYVFLMFVMIGMLLLGVGIVFPKKRYVKKKRRDGRKSNEEKVFATARLERLPSAERSIDEVISQVRSPEPVSVTEPTTRQLR